MLLGLKVKVLLLFCRGNLGEELLCSDSVEEWLPTEASERRALYGLKKELYTKPLVTAEGNTNVKSCSRGQREAGSRASTVRNWFKS